VDVKRKITALMNEEAGKYEEQQTIRSKVGRSSKHVHNVFPFCHNFPVFARAVEAKLFGQVSSIQAAKMFGTVLIF
ncbi:hypothetical protein SARC_17586, partial [Sphaeroforma arctica JP610]